jgi:hypothetical protein
MENCVSAKTMDTGEADHAGPHPEYCCSFTVWFVFIISLRKLYVQKLFQIGVSSQTEISIRSIIEVQNGTINLMCTMFAPQCGQESHDLRHCWK